MLIFVMLLCTHLCAEQPEELVRSMSVREKIGQLFLVPFTSNMQEIDIDYPMDQAHIEHLIKEYHIGAILGLRNMKSAEFKALVDHYQKLAGGTLLVALDAEWGLGMRLQDALSYPKNKMLGQLPETAIFEVGKAIGQQLRELGVHWNLAPVVDVNNNPDNPVIKDRSFGDDPALVTRAGLSYMYGLRAAGVLSCAKHFPGHGDTNKDSHYDLPVIPHSRERLNGLELVPFKAMIAAGVESIMTAHLHIPALDARTDRASSLSKAVVTDMLQKELGFEGVIVTDGLGMQAVRKYFEPGELELEALLAGNDMLIAVDVPKAVELIEAALQDGRFSIAELDRRVLKILKMKELVQLLN